MSDEASPRPWRIADGMHETIVDERNNIVANAADGATAALIVAAVNKHGMPITELIKGYDAVENERDRLRDLVRKTLHAIDALYTVAAPGAIVKELTPDRTCLGVPIGKIVAEARAAIREDKE